MNPRRLSLDFVATRPRVSRLAAALLVVGVTVVVGTFIDYRQLVATDAGLELQLAAIAPVEPAGQVMSESTVRVLTEAGGAIAELATPWSRLLADLEAASAGSQGNVALLNVEPDRDKQQLRILAEARSLSAALVYVRQLQKSKVLSYPMLESHEIRTNDRDRPVRVEITAGWRVTT